MFCPKCADGKGVLGRVFVVAYEYFESAYPVRLTEVGRDVVRRGESGGQSLPPFAST